MTYYPVFVDKEEWGEGGHTEYIERLVQICLTEEEAVNWIRNTNAKKIVEMAETLIPGLIDLLVRNVDEDTFYEETKSREFFTDEQSPYADETKTYRYDVHYERFSNDTGRW